MFCGEFSHSLDEKNRFKVPASMREELGIKTYLIKSPDPETPCIYIYSEKGWEILYNEFNKEGQHNVHTRRKARKILHGVVTGDVDKNGRLTLNATLKDFLGIEDEVFIVGNNNHIELWTPEGWSKELEALEYESTDGININF